MTEQAATAGLCAFTIGHSNHDEPTFLGLLRQHGIQVVADVRSQPYSKYTTHFNADQIKPLLAGAGIRYVFLGQELGGRPDGEEFYDPEGHVLYDRVAAAPRFREGIERLEKGLRQYRVALMCSEEDPCECHRHLLVSRVLAERGVEIIHIRGDGRLQSRADLERAAGDDARQQFLFGELEEQPWKSTRSALPKPRPPHSSES